MRCAATNETNIKIFMLTKLLLKFWIDWCSFFKRWHSICCHLCVCILKIGGNLFLLLQYHSSKLPAFI